MDKVLSVEEVAQVLKVRPHRVYQLTRSGDLKAVRIGRTVRVTEQALADFIERGGAPLDGARDTMKAGG